MGVPEAAAVKVAVDPAATVRSEGFWVMAAPTGKKLVREKVVLTEPAVAVTVYDPGVALAMQSGCAAPSVAATSPPPPTLQLGPELGLVYCTKEIPGMGVFVASLTNTESAAAKNVFTAVVWPEPEVTVMEAGAGGGRLVRRKLTIKEPLCAVTA